MKVLFKKIKNAGKGYNFFYFTSLILYITFYVFFFRSMLILQGIETALRIALLIFFGLFGILYLIFGLTSMITHKKKVFIPFTIFALIFTILFGISSYYINKIYNVLDNFTTSDTSTYTTVLLTLKDTELTDESVLGMINNETNRENYILAKEMIEKEKIKNEIKSEDYDDIHILLSALYNGEVDGIFISKDYPILFGNEEKYQNILQETKVVKSYSKEMKTEESEMISTKSLTEPFTVLVLGVDSEFEDELDPNAAFNGDTLMLITFNPQTLNATMFSIPRDLYVPISCNNNRYSKINSAAYGGTSCVVDTIENLTDIEIDYFIKIDFKAVVDLVETIGGIDVNVEPPDYDYYNSVYNGRLCEQDSLRRFGEHLICMDTGMQHLNGEQALAYARNRHGYLESDIARGRHQQLVLEAIAQKLVQTASISDFENILDTISKHIATNMKTTQILSFYQTIKSMLIQALAGNDFINIQKTYLTYYNIETYLGGYQVSALGYYSGSLDAITEAMKENLGILKTETIRTFEYDYKEDYERSSEIIGKGIYKGSTLNFMPDFRGESVSTAKSFANNNDLSLNIEYESDPDEIEGIILRQSIPEGTMVKNISGFTIYVNNYEEEKQTTIDNDKETDNDTETNNDKEEDKEQNNEQDKEQDNKQDKEENNSNKNDTTPNKEEEKQDSKPNDKKEDEEEETIPGNPSISNPTSEELE